MKCKDSIMTFTNTCIYESVNIEGEELLYVHQKSQQLPYNLRQYAGHFCPCIVSLQCDLLVIEVCMRKVESYAMHKDLTDLEYSMSHIISVLPTFRMSLDHY